MTRAVCWRRALAVLAATWLIGPAAGCKRSSTGLLVVVATHLVVPDEIDRVEIQLELPDGQHRETSAALVGEDRVPLPLTLGVLAGRDPEATVTVTVTGYKATTAIVRRRARAAFVRDQVRVLRTTLERSCLQRLDCGEGQSCIAGSCQPDQVPASELTPWQRDDGGSAGAPPCRGVEIRPEQELQAAIDAQPEDTVFCVRAGTYRLAAPLVPKRGQQFLGDPGAVLSGARVLTDWVAASGAWYVDGQTQGPSRVESECEPGFVCALADDVYRDDQPLRRVESIGQLVSGAFFFDYAADRIYVGDEPQGHRVEASVSAVAFGGMSPATGVAVRGLVIEKFATSAPVDTLPVMVFADNAAVTAASGWIVEGNEVRLNHGGGITTRSGAQVRNNYVHHNGEYGLGGHDTADVLVEGNQIAFNNTARYEATDWLGGARFAGSTGLRMLGNHIHDNHEMGLRLSDDVYQVRFENNLVERNLLAGLVYNVSYDGVIRGNTFRGNGQRAGEGLWQADPAIKIYCSSNVEIDHNRIEDNASAVALIEQVCGAGSRGEHVVRNVFVHDNDVRLGAGHVGAVTDTGDSAIFTSRNNRFERNTYHLARLDETRFTWMNDDHSSRGWQGFGLDTMGTFLSP